jgi:hypothetical protein
VIRNANQTLITEVVFLDWLARRFIPTNDQVRRKANYDGRIIFIGDAHASASLPASACIQLVTHSSDISQVFDLCDFAVFKMLPRREAKRKRMNGETLKWYRAIPGFYQSIIIPKLRLTFDRAGFCLNPTGLFVPITVIPDRVLDRIRMREIPLEEYVFPAPTEASSSSRQSAFPAMHDFVVKLLELGASLPQEGPRRGVNIAPCADPSSNRSMAEAVEPSTDRRLADAIERLGDVHFVALIVEAGATQSLKTIICLLTSPHAVERPALLAFTEDQDFTVQDDCNPFRELMGSMGIQNDCNLSPVQLPWIICQRKSRELTAPCK